MLLTWGVTLVVTQSDLLAPVRRYGEGLHPKLGTLLSCPMCASWWVGLAASIAGMGPMRATWLPLGLVLIGDAFCASGWCWFAHVTCSALRRARS